MNRPAAIIIFGAAVQAGGAPSAELRRRVNAALTWGAKRPGTIYLPTGAVGRHPPAEAAVMAGLLRSAGVPAGLIWPEPSGTDTLSSVRACRRLLRARGHAGPVLAASGGWHLPRCVLLLRLAGLPARAVPPMPGPVRLYWRLREVPALPYDAVLLLWARLRGRL